MRISLISLLLLIPFFNTISSVEHKAGSVTEIRTIAELDSLKGKGKPVAVKVSTDTCQPCKQMAPVYAKVAQSHPDVIFLEFNVTGNDAAFQELKKRYKVQVYPALVLIDKEGKQKGKTEHGGILNPAEIDAIIKVLKGELVWMELPEGQTPPQGAQMDGTAPQQMQMMPQQMREEPRGQTMGQPQRPMVKARVAQPGEELYAMRGGKMVRVTIPEPTVPGQAPKKAPAKAQRRKTSVTPKESKIHPTPMRPMMRQGTQMPAKQQRMYSQEEVEHMLRGKRQRMYSQDEVDAMMRGKSSQGNKVRRYRNSRR